MNQVLPGFPKFSIFSYIPLFVKAVFPEVTVVGVSLMIALAVETLKCIEARFALLGLKPRWIDLIVSLATLGKLLVMLS